MKNTLFKDLRVRHLSHEIQVQRMKAVIQKELTPLQRETVAAYYFENQTLQQIADRRNVSKSTVWRTLKRAETKIRRVLQY